MVSKRDVNVKALVQKILETFLSVLDYRLKKTLITDLFTRSTKKLNKNGVRELTILLFFIS